MITRLMSDSTGEIFELTQEQVFQLRDACPDDNCVELLGEYVELGTSQILPMGAWYFVCWLGTRCWLGIKRGKEHQA